MSKSAIAQSVEGGLGKDSGRRKIDVGVENMKFESTKWFCFLGVWIGWTSSLPGLSDAEESLLYALNIKRAEEILC